mmetsp:Transcript_71571/g.128844  ORF Transcript_71571/g.128844 Transcript_71571/m.128844 type:complete len:309 (+) Transcript_71571:658-1584(+)
MNLDLASTLHLHCSSGILFDFQDRRRFALGFRNQEVHQFIAIKLKHGAYHPALAVDAITAYHFEELVSGAGNQAGTVLASVHGVRLAGSSLPIRKHCHIEAVDARANQSPAVCKDILLRRVLVEDSVEVEVFGWLLHISLVVDLHGERVQLPNPHLVSSLTSHLRPDPRKHTDGTLHVLHLVVVSFPQHLLLGKRLCKLISLLLVGLEQALCNLRPLFDPIQVADLSCQVHDIQLQLLCCQLLLLRGSLPGNLSLADRCLSPLALLGQLVALLSELRVLGSQLRERVPGLLALPGLPLHVASETLPLS